MHLFLNLEVSKLRKQTQVPPSATVLHGLLLNLIAIIGMSSGHVLTLSLPTADSFFTLSFYSMFNTFSVFQDTRLAFFLEGMRVASSKYTHNTLGIWPATWIRSNDPTLTEQLPMDLLNPDYAPSFMFMNPHSKFMKRNPTRCNSASKFYYFLFIWSWTSFGRHIAHHQEPKIALAASGFSYVEGCWTCIWWTLSGTVLCLFVWSSTCFGRHTAHHQEPKTALAVSSFSYVEGCWSCSWWTLSGTVLCLFVWSSTCFGRHTAHHQEPKTALAFSSFSYVEGCWTCSWWTLSGRVYSTQHVSGDTPPIIRSLKLHWHSLIIHTWKVVVRVLVDVVRHCLTTSTNTVQQPSTYE